MISWILGANATEARFYMTPKAKLLNGEATLKLVKEYKHPEGRQKSGDLVSDKPGNYKNPRVGHGTFAEPTDPKEHELDVFAKQLADELEAARIANHYQDLIIITPSHFDGLLNKHLNHHHPPPLWDHHHH